MNDEEIVRAQAGMGVDQPPSPELPVAQIQPLATAQPTEPSVRAGTTALAWWDADKYYWRNNASGRGAHLAPQETYIADVLDRGELYVDRADITKDDEEAFGRMTALLTELIQEFDAFDTSGVEGLAWRRFVLSRSVIARKICGASAVSSEQRVTNELSRENGDVVKLQADSEGFYQSDIDKRDRWAEKTRAYQHLTVQTADGEVVPKVAAALTELVNKRISRSLYDDAVERGNKLKRPAYQATTDAKKPSREELLAMTA